MSDAKLELVQQAKLALKAERYEDMAAFMKKVVEMTTVLSNEEQDLLSVGYRRVVCARLSAWSIIRTIEQKTEGSEKKQQLAKEYRKKIELEIREICGNILGLLDNCLLPNAATAKSQMFFRMLKLEFYAYLAEIAPGEGKCDKSPPSGSAELCQIEASPPLPITNTTPIDSLKDADLTAIFKCLPPYERLIVSEVCRRWHGLSQKAWLDVSTLDLSNVPAPNIAAVLRQCPYLQSVTSVGRTSGTTYLHSLAQLSLSSVKLYDCVAAIPETRLPANSYSTIFSGNLQSAAWDELVLHNCYVALLPPDFDFPASFPRSLKRLQLSGSFYGDVHMLTSGPYTLPRLLNGLDQLQQLECLILLADSSTDGRFCPNSDPVVPMLSRMSNLRELYVGPLGMPFDYHPSYTFLPANLPMLEVLFLHKAGVEIVSNFLEGIPRLTTLRILLITGSMMYLTAAVECPARKSFPTGFGVDPLPLLHVFLGKRTRARINFAENSDAMKVVEIDGRLSEFLERADIKPIFADVWIAEKIKETAKRGVRKWDNDKF